ncbi:MAG: aminotransferase class III-fold pyridoxal phosphate-dependent enzyme, partial [Dehalococcoidales bacterium]
MNNNWFDEEHKYYMPTFKRLPVMLVRGKGNLVWDENGKEYLDFVAGWAVNALGHCHPVVVEATIQQASQLIHTSNSYYTIPQLKLARLLVENSCMDKVFCCNSGTEATEGAVKLARRYGHLHLNGAY